MSDLFGLTQAAAGGYSPTGGAKTSAWPARKVSRYGGAARHGHSPADPLGRPPCDRASMEASAAWIESQLEMTRIAKNTTDMRGPPAITASSRRKQSWRRPHPIQHPHVEIL